MRGPMPDSSSSRNGTVERGDGNVLEQYKEPCDPNSEGYVL
jgi:hypothetical protein